jgi:hypothetical protein
MSKANESPSLVRLLLDEGWSHLIGYVCPRGITRGSVCHLR